MAHGVLVTGTLAFSFQDRIADIQHHIREKELDQDPKIQKRHRVEQSGLLSFRHVQHFTGRHLTVQANVQCLKFKAGSSVFNYVQKREKPA